MSLDDETALWARVEAARNDTSLSRFVGDVLRERMHSIDSHDDDYLRAMQSYLRRMAMPLGELGQPYPSRDEIHRR